MAKTNKCEFCSKAQAKVRFLIAGPTVMICNECVDVCIDILEEKGLRIRGKSQPKVVDLTEYGIRPRFKTLRFEVRDNHCFHLSPFAEPFNTVYTDHIRKAANGVGFTIERADEVFGAQPIIEDIWQSINSATVVVADVTGRNPNVMYEIGMAHTVGKTRHYYDSDDG